jgi:NADPH-dependent 2,4-dienoyl-CoA reductase/sulfur reductase-like enzyme
MAAQTLREDRFSGRVLIISRDDRAPYDRPNLSKDYLQGHAESEWMPLRGEEFFADHDIELMLGKEVVSVDATKKTVQFSDGQTLTYDSLLVATGGVPRKLPFQSDEQENVFLLRSFADSDAIIAAAGKGKRVVVIGSSFIGMEAASSLKIRGCDVTVVAPDEVPFADILGREIGELFQHIHEQNGVKFKLGTQVTSFAGNGRVEAVILENGERLQADLVIVGIGVKPATDFLVGVELHKDGGVIADEHLSIGEALYAAGDITHFPDARTGEHTRIEHWRTALQQGRVAAHNMVGKPTPFTSVPFFWTTQFDATLNYVGHAKEWDEIMIQGDVRQRDFLAFYIKAAKILAVAGMNRDREMDLWEERMRLSQMPSPDQLKER